MLRWGPILLLAVPSGAIADHVVERGLLMATQAGQACTALTVVALVVTGVVAYWHVGILALGTGLANTDNEVRQSLVLETLPVLTSALRRVRGRRSTLPSASDLKESTQ
jgi:hypothetical protein